MDDRFATTTRKLRLSAANQLMSRGTRAFSVEAVAREAGTAVGTVYERWNDKFDLLSDTLSEVLLPRVRDVAASCVQHPLDERLRVVFDSPEGREVAQIVAEVLFAARDHAILTPLVDEALAMLDMAVFSATSVGRGPRWWVTSLSIGWGVLSMGEVNLPPLGADVAHVLRSPGDVVQPRRDARIERPPTPDSYADALDDGLSIRIVSTAREMLSGVTNADFSARGVAREAGVSVGALYRRYGSRADLIRQVLLTDMHEARFAWSDDLIEVLVDADPVNRAAEMLARVLERVHSDQGEAQRLLEITVAARTSDAVRTHIVEHIGSAVVARFELARRLQEAGVISHRPDATSLSWFIQAVPIGFRLLASVNRIAPQKTITEGLRHICAGCLEQ